LSVPVSPLKGRKHDPEANGWVKLLLPSVNPNPNPNPNQYSNQCFIQTPKHRRGNED